MDRSRSVRIFLSSTFRDFGEERDLLVRKVFPALRVRLKDRFVELVDVDLRWGITVEEAERGEVLPICLAEIDRSRPYFIGMLGERYGWIPPQEGYAPDLLERQPWLKRHQGGKSVTELEILHGVLKNKRMKSRAFFYFRSPAYARAKGGHYVPDSTEDRQRQLDLKRRIKDSGYSVTGYRDPEALAKRMERDLWKLLDAEFPATEVPDAFERESMRHEAYAAPRRRLYLGGDEYIHALNALLKKNASRILITGQSGGGKSALLANALAKHRGSKTHLLEHYLGSSSDAADALALVRRVIEYIRRVTGNTDPVAADTEELFDSVHTWLAIASAFAKKNRTRWIFVLDALNNLNGYRNLKWFPAYLPERIQIVVSCLEGEVIEVLETKGAWDYLVIEPLDPNGQRQLLTEYLKRFNKSLPADLLNQALGHPLANNPLWLKTLAEELRLFGSHEELSHRLNTLLGPPKGKGKDEPPTVDDLFEHVLQRIEGDQGRKLVRDALTAIWASRAGLSEPELLEILAPHSVTTGKAKKANKLPPAQWAPVRNALDEMLLESGGRIIFGHDYVKVAVKDRYLPRESLQRNAHKKLAEHFAKRKVDERVAEELPHQWREAKAWRRLEQTLTGLEMFEALNEHRTDEEHLGYWLSIEAVKGRQILEARLKNAWMRWNLPLNMEKTADVAGNLQQFIRYAGRGLKGSFTLKLAKLVLNINEKVRGTEHQETGNSLNELGILYYNKGYYKDAEHFFRRSLAIAEKELGNQHDETGSRLNNLGTLLVKKADFQGAEIFMKRALVISEKVNGPEHPLTGSRLAMLGSLLHSKGDIEGAELLFRRSLAIIEKTQGPEHPETGICLNNFGTILSLTANFNKAKPLLLRALSILEKAFGYSHPEVVTVLGNLANLYEKTGDNEDAEKFARRSLAVSETNAGLEHPSTGTCLNNLGNILRNKEDLAGAELAYKRSLAISEKTRGLDHPETGKVSSNLGTLLQEIGDYKVAEQLLRKALTISENTNGLTHYNNVEQLKDLSILLIKTERIDEALELLNRKLAIVQKYDGHNSYSAAEAHRLLGVAYREASNYEKSMKEFKQSLNIFESANTRKSKNVARVLNGMGQLEALRSNFAEAVNLFAEALEISRAVSPDNVEDIEKRLKAAREGKSI